jgi:hypothetical protein
MYRFTVNDGTTDTTVTPLVDGLRKRYELDGKGRFYVRKINPLLFVGDDYTFFKALYDAGECEKISLLIEERCEGEWIEYFLGSIPLYEGNYDLDRCEVEFEIRTDDEYECFQSKYEKEQNWLSFGSAKTVRLIYGSIETITCQTSIAPPTLSNSVLWFSRHCLSGTWVNDTDPDPATAWRPIQHTQHLETGACFVSTTYAREKATSVLSPPGDGWINTSGTTWVRPIVYGKISDVINDTPAFDERFWSALLLNPKFYSNARYLDDVLDGALTDINCDILEFRSDFLGINPPGTAPSNDAYDYAALYLQDMLILQKSDVVRVSASNDATILTTSIRAFLDDMRDLMDVYYAIETDGTDKWVRLEHYTYFEGQNGLDLTDAQYAKFLVGSNSFKQAEQVPKFEQLGYQESYLEAFLDEFINYPEECSRAAGIDGSCKLISADVGGLTDNEDAGLDGLVLVAGYPSGTEYLLSTLGGVANGALALENIILNLKPFGRYHEAATSVPTFTVQTIRRLKQQVAITIPWCCGLFDETELIQTGLGWGQLKSAEHDTKRGTLTIELLQ